MSENDFNGDHNEQPTHIIVLKVIFFISSVVLISGIILFVSAMGTSSASIAGVVMIGVGVLAAGSTFSSAFEPEFEKMRMKKDRYIQKETEKIQEDISSRKADINYRATKKGARAFKEGWTIEKCPFCGDKVSGDEQFCDKCGKPLYSQCKGCKTINSGDSKFCKKCGKEL